MRRWLRALAALATLSTLPAAADIAAPESWRKETFQFPLPFAPSIPYEGTEHVRFAPYWTDFTAERGFTYVVLWDVKRRALEPAELERGLLVYFDGLMESVTRARKIADPGTVTSVALHPMAAPAGWTTASGGRLWTWNGFAKGEPLTLHLEISYRPCGEDRMQVFHAFSRAERTRPAWDELREIRAATRCAS
ncbi:MAG TPA: hypothetical protein VM122_12655 [Usitatibacter sp.]|nr:hypothetical protein [Usitatibacter sp.]